MERRAINLAEKLAKCSEHWSPKIVARMNDYESSSSSSRASSSGTTSPTPTRSSWSASGCKAMLVETAGTVNTGAVVDAKTAAADAWI